MNQRLFSILSLIAAGACSTACSSTGDANALEPNQEAPANDAETLTVDRGTAFEHLERMRERYLRGRETQADGNDTLKAGSPFYLHYDMNEIIPETQVADGNTHICFLQGVRGYTRGPSRFSIMASTNRGPIKVTKSGAGPEAFATCIPRSFFAPKADNIVPFEANYAMQSGWTSASFGTGNTLIAVNGFNVGKPDGTKHGSGSVTQTGIKDASNIVSSRSADTTVQYFSRVVVNADNAVKFFGPYDKVTGSNASVAGEFALTGQPGQAVVRELIAEQQGFCYFTKLGGDLATGEDMALLEVMDGKWFMTVYNGTGSTDISIASRCVSYNQ